MNVEQKEGKFVFSVNGQRALPAGKLLQLEVKTSDTIDPESGLKTPFWQMQDLDYLKTRDWSANFSEMGCFKTSTGLWLAKDKTRDKTNPGVLIVTTRSGKGEYFKLAPLIFKGWTIFNVTTTGIYVYIEGREVKLPKLKFLPKKIDVPHVVLTHYHVFSRSNKGRYEEDEQGRPALLDDWDVDKDGNVTVKKVLKPKEWTQADHILNHEWDATILDEAHRIKDRDAKWTVNLKKMKTAHRHIMTGTGFINRPDELWSLLNFLNRSEFSSYHRFMDHFCEIDTWSGFTQVVGVNQENKEEFRDLVRTVGVRRTLDEVMPNIREPLFQRHEIDLNPTQRKMYNEIKTALRTLDQQGAEINSPNVLSLLNRLRQITVATPQVVGTGFDRNTGRRVQHVRLVEPSSKLDTVMEILEGLEWDEENRHPLVVFSNFRDPLELLKARLDKHNEACDKMGMHEDMYMRYIHLQQEDNDQARMRKWREEFPSMKYRVFMSTLQLGGESINLTPARHVVFLDRSWSPKDNMQGIGRIRRPGQEGQPIVINIEANNTTDSYVERTNIRKHGWFSEVFGDE